MKIKEAKENILKNWRANYTTDHMDNHDKEVFLLNAMEQLESIVKQETTKETDKYVKSLQEDITDLRYEIRTRNRIIAVLIEKAGGQARIFDRDLLDEVEVRAEVSYADNSTLFTLKK